jgi:hypothetical protein
MFDWLRFVDVMSLFHNAGTYALVITGRREVGSYHGSAVYVVTSMKFLCCNSTLRLSNSQEVSLACFFGGLRSQTAYQSTIL